MRIRLIMVVLLAGALGCVDRSLSTEPTADAPPFEVPDDTPTSKKP